MTTPSILQPPSCESNDNHVANCSRVMPLPGPVTEITGAHVNAFLRALHNHYMNIALAEPDPPQP